MLHVLGKIVDLVAHAPVHCLNLCTGLQIYDAVREGHDDICLITRTQEAALTDMEQTGWIMAHQFNQALNTDYLFFILSTFHNGAIEKAFNHLR